MSGYDPYLRFLLVPTGLLRRDERVAVHRDAAAQRAEDVGLDRADGVAHSGARVQIRAHEELAGEAHAGVDLLDAALAVWRKGL